MNRREMNCFKQWKKAHYSEGSALLRDIEYPVQYFETVDPKKYRKLLSKKKPTVYEIGEAYLYNKMYAILGERPPLSLEESDRLIKSVLSKRNEDSSIIYAYCALSEYLIWLHVYQGNRYYKASLAMFTLLDMLKAAVMAPSASTNREREHDRAVSLIQTIDSSMLSYACSNAIYLGIAERMKMPALLYNASGVTTEPMTTKAFYELFSKYHHILDEHQEMKSRFPDFYIDRLVPIEKDVKFVLKRLKSPKDVEIFNTYVLNFTGYLESAVMYRLQKESQKKGAPPMPPLEPIAEDKGIELDERTDKYFLG